MPRTLLAFFLIFLATHARAADVAGHYEVLGVGNNTCNDYLIQRDPNPYERMYADPLNHENSAQAPDPHLDREYLSWMYGYLSAFDQWVRNTYSVRAGVDVEELRNWVTQYCLSHRDTRFHSAVEAFVDTHFAKRMSSDPGEGRNAKR
jgi:hypothetical protein